MPAPLRPSCPHKTNHRKPVSDASATNRTPSHAKVWIIFLLILALGGGYYYYDQSQKEETARQAKLAAQREAEEARKAAAEKKRKEEEAARKKAEEEAKAEAERQRLAAEEAERQRLAAEEAARKAAEEEEARRRAAKEQEKKPVEVVPDEKPQPEEKASPYEAELPLAGENSSASATRDQFKALAERVFTEGDYEDFAAAFDAKIKACIPELIAGDKLNYSAYKRHRNLVQAIDLCLLIHMAQPRVLRSVTHPKTAGESQDGGRSGRDFMLWAINDKTQPLHKFLQSFIGNGGRPENMGASIVTFHKLWSATPPKDRAKYLNLAIACSLLSPQAANSPGMVIKPSTPILTVPQVYDYFREMDGKKKLLTDIKKMDVSDLLYVVNVRLPRSEFDWVMANMDYTQANWGSAYASIRYLMERATENKNPYTHYTFAEIRKEGGVCRDQGYFAANTARCKGIPAVYITGDGDRGGHAWIASMVDKTTWKQTGSYGYNTGRFENPCSGRLHHESVLLNQSKKTTDGKLQGAYDGMLLSDYLVLSGCETEARGAAKFVTNSFPAMTMAWANRINVLSHDKENLPPVAEWRKISNTLMLQGRKNPELIDLAADIENEYLLDGKSDSAKKSALKRSANKLKKSVGNSRSDLVLEAVKRQADLLAEEKDWRGMARLYKQNLKANTARGDVFEQMLGQYMSILREAGDDVPASAWATLVKDADTLFNKHVRSNGGDYFKVKKECAIMELIANAYEESGNTAKAEKLRSEAAQRLESSKG